RLVPLHPAALPLRARRTGLRGRARLRVRPDDRASLPARPAVGRPHRPVAAHKLPPHDLGYVPLASRTHRTRAEGVSCVWCGVCVSYCRAIVLRLLVVYAAPHYGGVSPSRSHASTGPPEAGPAREKRDQSTA